MGASLFCIVAMCPKSSEFYNSRMNRHLTPCLLIIAVAACCADSAKAQGWPTNYEGVMLQGFSWDDYTNSKWTTMEANADEYSQYFSLIWVPQSGNCDGKSMGYNPKYYFDQNSSFGSEAELRSMISTFKQKNVGIIADVVINHRANLSNWVDFPAETYKGVTYQMVSTDIPYDDDGGACKTWADANGYELSPNRDSGEGWGGMRDLDHASENVQKCIFAYEDFLLNDLGYTGFRYDVGKGFAAKYFGLYNSKANPQFSVGEVWDSNNVIKNWIKNTTTDGAVQSAAFDFQFRYAVRDMIAGGYGSNSAPAFDSHSMLIAGTDYRRYAVTFVENHDTQDRTATGGDKQDPIKVGGELKANAILLGMPGTPCVFQPHWLAYKNDIKQMILARKAAGIKSESEWHKIACSTSYYAWSCENLGVIVGKPSTTSIGSEFVLIQSVDDNYYYFLKKECEMPWVTLASGSFEAGTSQSVRLVAVSESEDAQLVYTTDGSTPSASNGHQVASNTELSLTESTILKVGLLVNGSVTNVETRTYTFVEKDPEQPFDAYKATMHVRNESGAMDPLYVYVWAGADNFQINGNWPGQKATETAQVGGETWYVQTFDITAADYVVNFVFANSKGDVQTVDVTGMTHDAFYVINSSQSGAKYTVTDVTSQYTGISAVMEDVERASLDIVYNLQGQPVTETKRGFLYIRNGHKYILR